MLQGKNATELLLSRGLFSHRLNNGLEAIFAVSSIINFSYTSIRLDDWKLFCEMNPIWGRAILPLRLPE